MLVMHPMDWYSSIVFSSLFFVILEVNSCPFLLKCFIMWLLLVLPELGHVFVFFLFPHHEKSSHIKAKKMTNHDEVCIPSLSSILLAVNEAWSTVRLKFQVSGKHEIFEKTWRSGSGQVGIDLLDLGVPRDRYPKNPEVIGQVWYWIFCVFCTRYLLWLY